MRVCVFVCVVCVCVGGNDKKKTIIIMLHGAGRDRRAWLRCAIVTRSLLTYSRSLLIYCGSLLIYCRSLLRYIRSRLIYSRSLLIYSRSLLILNHTTYLRPALELPDPAMRELEQLAVRLKVHISICI